MLRCAFVSLCFLAGCYSGVEVSRDINRAWTGRSAASLEASWGKADKRVQQDEATLLHWMMHHQRITRLPSAEASLKLDGRGLDAYGAFRSGESERYTTAMTAAVDASGTIIDMEGPSIRFGAPRGANLRHGFLFGAAGGMGMVDDATDVVPSLSMYIGGMLSRTLGLVGTFTWANGSSSSGNAMGFAWGMGVAYWPQTRLSLRAGPAMVLGLEPGLEDPSIEAGIDASASYALITLGSFVTDLRLNVVAGTETQFGLVGIGVNIN